MGGDGRNGTHLEVPVYHALLVDVRDALHSLAKELLDLALAPHDTTDACIQQLTGSRLRPDRIRSRSVFFSQCSIWM